MSDSYLKFLKYFKADQATEYIRSIRFPCYKNLTGNTNITFDSPFTVLAGPNGAGKSSILQALHGCAEGKSVSDYWFSTIIDPIQELKDNRNRYIYKYKPENYSKHVEVRQARTLRNKTKIQREDPDYWETTRPSMGDKMARMSSYPNKPKDIGDRWSKMKAEVVYIDFRSELSSYDKFFYFGAFEKGHRIKNKKDFVRTRSKTLNKHINNFKGKPLYWGKGINNCTRSICTLTDEELVYVNSILGKHYISAKIVHHSLFNNTGYSILFKKNNLEYSEAAAGSGEVSVVNCVRRVMQAPTGSLILLDEPEVSLHPAAQTKLREFLLERIVTDNHQIIMSTHSEHFVKNLPYKAVKLFLSVASDGKFDIRNECSPEQAFIRLGVENENCKRIYVEDILSVHIVEEALKEIDPNCLEAFKIITYPGGAEKILTDKLIHFAFDDESKDRILLDGDKTIQIGSNGVISSSEISPAQECNIDEILREQTGINADKFKFPANGGDGATSNEQHLLDCKKMVLDAYHTHVSCMNFDTPEELIWKISEDGNNTLLNLANTKSQFTTGNYKDRFVQYTISIIGKSECNGSSILNNQKVFLKSRNKEHPLWIKFKELLMTSLELTSI